MLKLWSSEIPTHVKVRHLNNVLHALLDCSNPEEGGGGDVKHKWLWFSALPLFGWYF